MTDGLELPIERVEPEGPAVDALNARKEGAAVEADMRLLAGAIEAAMEGLRELISTLPDPEYSSDLRRRQNIMKRINSLREILYSKWLGD